MPVVRIFAVRPAEGVGGEGLENLVAARALVYQNQEGFLSLELLEPTDGREPWLLLSRWADEASYDRFVGSPGFTDHPGGDRVAAYGGPDSVASELWSFRVAVEASA